VDVCHAAVLERHRDTNDFLRRKKTSAFVLIAVSGGVGVPTRQII
jgi:hypothetical protein